MEKDPWLTQDQQHVWRQYLAISRLLNDRVERNMQRDGGMPQAYYLILAMLSEAPDHSLRMNQLADVLRASQSRTSHAVTKLESYGWIRREATPSDGRGQSATLTDAGWTRLRLVAPDHAETVRSIMFDALDEKDLADLGRIYGKLLAHMEPQTEGEKDTPPRPTD
ncbi:MarR family transcriptional regulator [Nakamurella antarctica]|uniref:MarR family transcriptional regulator n=1 Tax=Nakamurella antarctica TaxID=1902245 RepID=A0A3G8ZIZ6_9ACTN|nr:MarR family winged helix-turn-helix transcriptional regulator [Nakamurella antarctica]AZI57168.1 MarR family transcriptional regulator [Nakamurella antarctica]